MRDGWTLWGSHPEYVGGVPIKLTAGTIAHCRIERKRRAREGWTLAAAPTGAPRPWFPGDAGHPGAMG